MKVSKEIQRKVRKVLKAWNLQKELPRFVSSPDGLALAAHLCNAAAKFISSEFYDLKSDLVREAAEAHVFSWHRDGVIYIETCVGQVSFHIFEDEDFYIEDRETPWAGGWMQDAAYLMALAFVNNEVPEFENFIQKTQKVSVFD